MNASKSNTINANRQPRRKLRRGRKAPSAALTGSGDYNLTTDEFKSIVSKLDTINSKIPSARNALTNLGATAGALLGRPELGRAMGEKVAHLVGFGDYHLISNTLMKGPYADAAVPLPKFINQGNAVRVREREFLGDVMSAPSPKTFLNRSYPITPTDKSTFPWLSTLANQFDQWEPHGIVFEFVSTSSDFNGSNQGLGSVIMATDYDVLDTPYASKIEMDNADYASSCKPSMHQIHGIECDPAQRPYRTMYTKTPGVSVANRNTLGNFQIASTGVSSSNVALGELWVTYDISFYKKQINAAAEPVLNITGNYNATTDAWTVTTTVNDGGFSFEQDPILATRLNIHLPTNTDQVTYLAEIYWSTTPGVTVGTFLIPGSGISLTGPRYSNSSTPTDPFMQCNKLTVTGGSPTLQIQAIATATFACTVVAVPTSYAF